MRARGANIQHAATKVTNGEDCASMVRQFVSLPVWYLRMMFRQFALNTKLSTSSVLLKHFVVIYIIKLREYYHTDRSTR